MTPPSSTTSPKPQPRINACIATPPPTALRTPKRLLVNWCLRLGREPKETTLELTYLNNFLNTST